MRYPRITGVAVASALVATVTGGAFAATAASAEAPHHSVFTAAKAPQDAAALAAQARALAGAADMVKPTSRLITDVLSGTASVPTVTKDAAAAKAAVSAARHNLLQPAAPASPGSPGSPASPAAPQGSGTQMFPGGPGSAAVPKTPGKSAATRSTRDAEDDPLDLLSNAIDALVAAFMADDPATDQLDAANSLFTELMNAMAALFPATGLPMPDLPLVPAAPAAPATPGVPAGPAPTAAPAL